MNARKLLETKALCQTICNFSKNEATNNTLKVLYFIDEYKAVSPSLLISKLGIVKSNLALLTKNMIKDRLIEAYHTNIDRRTITYRITQKGRNMLNEYLEKIEKIFRNSDPSLEQAFDTILEFLNKKV